MIRHSNAMVIPGSRIHPSGVDKNGRVKPVFICWRCGMDVPRVYRARRTGLCRDCRPYAKDYPERSHP